MAETPDQIEHDIEAEREQLSKNLEQLETKIKRATDWREVVGRYPVAALGAAFGVGFVISVLIGSREAEERWYEGGAVPYERGSFGRRNGAARSFRISG